LALAFSDLTLEPFIHPPIPRNLTRSLWDGQIYGMGICKVRYVTVLRSRFRLSKQL
jgi:hypothetical protein